MLVLALALSGCASDPLAAQYREVSGKNYIAGDGTVTEITAEEWNAPIEFSGTLGVAFLGVNIRDQTDTTLTYSNTFGITYPSVIDADNGAVQLAFSGVVAPNAVPTTLVVDQDGRVAARVLGRISNASILDALIQTALEERDQ